MNIPETAPLPNETRVWDPVVRIFHWSLAAAFTVDWLTGEEESRLHELAGYAVIGLVLIRIVWGFVGTKYARFRDFVHRPSTVLAYARDILTGKSKRYLGHNPLGGLRENSRMLIYINESSMFPVAFIVTNGSEPLFGGKAGKGDKT